MVFIGIFLILLGLGLLVFFESIENIILIIFGFLFNWFDVNCVVFFRLIFVFFVNNVFMILIFLS